MVFVQHILGAARKRLAVLSQGAPLTDAAAILTNPDTPLVVVCDEQSIAVGVISSSDLVKVFATAKSNALGMNAGAIMSHPVVSCQVDEPLQRVWEIINPRSLRCVPILDTNGRPQGVLHAREVALALLNEVEYEEGLLRDYFLGVGYQ
jgi:CBS domain-containing protein